MEAKAGNALKSYGREPNDSRGEMMPILYRYLKVDGHPNATATGCVLEHRLVIEMALGRALPKKHIVHHVNGDRHDNRPCNLVACESIGYHKLLHNRERSLRETGDPNQYKCAKCNTWKPVDGFYEKHAAYLPQGTCKHCRREMQRQYYSKNSSAIIDYQRAYRAGHKEELREYDSKRRNKNG
jgi:hypothetical protein